MLYKKVKPIIFLFFFVVGLSAQDIPVQIIRGTLTDAISGKVLVGASVILPGTIPLKGTTTDENGKYRLENVPVGRYSLEATYIGYELLVIPEVLVESGKEVILHLSLLEAAADLSEVVVKTKSNYGAALSPVSLQSITVEEVLRFPATFNDPARLAMTYPGVVNTNDQANHISVRGNSPNSTSWRLEGAEIVNPNHLGDAGTSDGRPSISGGGVNILSAQLLGTSSFYSSAFPVAYGNALGGIMDMRFRNGNDEKQEFTAQASLVGFDFSAEGPLSKKKGVSYLVNYRYSFVGLLTAMGVDFGGEAISFQDLAFNVKMPIGKNAVLKIFGMGGLSENVFTGKENSEDWEVDKDRFNIDFTNKMGALGSSISSRFSEKLSFDGTIISSAVRTNKRSDLMDANGGETISAWAFDSLLHRKTSLHARLNYQLNRRHRFQFGTADVAHTYDINTQNYLDRSKGSDVGILLGNYMQWLWSPVNSLDIKVGLHHAYFTLSKNNHSFEPRTSVRWRASLKDRFSIAYGLHSQLQPGQLYFVYQDPERPNKSLDFSKSHHFVFNYTRSLTAFSEISLEAYYQSLFEIPVHTGIVDFGNNFSGINLLSDFTRLDVVNQGTGRNYGVELNWQRFIRDDYFFLVNTSLYQSKYKDQSGVERNSRFNGQYLFNLTGGKEFTWQKKGRKKILGINARATYAGGLWYTPIDEEASKETNLRTVLNYNDAFTKQQRDYFKVDFRIYLKNNKAKYNSTFAIDLQNLTSRKNDGYYYYDHVQDKVLVQKQLGLIPNLSYRIEF